MKNTQKAQLKGWVKTHRSILAHPVSRNPRLFALYITLTLLAPRDGGEIVTTTRLLADATGLGRSRVAETLAGLKKIGLVSVQAHHEGLVIKLLPIGTASFSDGDVSFSDGAMTFSDENVSFSDGDAHSSLYNIENGEEEKEIKNNSSSYPAGSFEHEILRLIHERETPILL